MKTKASSLLQIARQNIIDNGWTRYNMGVPGGPCCTMGAVYWVCDNYKDFSIKSRMYDFLKSVIGERNIGYWNDAPWRTQEDVLKAFDDAISLAVSEECFETV